MERSDISPIADPAVPDWAGLNLPDAWPDGLGLPSLRGLLRLLLAVFGRRRPLQLADEMPGRSMLPKYLLQEFHNLPNGNYSKQVTRGYITGFDYVMLGRMRAARRRIAEALSACNAVLDVGTAGGSTAKVLKQAGLGEVWGLDPSPYMLQHAARAVPEVHFVQGVAERTGFADARFDGISACFLLHEIPSRMLDGCLREFARILRPGGLLAICEPSAQHWRLSLRNLRPTNLYFHFLAHRVYDPFIQTWHRYDIAAALDAVGFELLEHTDAMPLLHLLARRREAA